MANGTRISYNPSAIAGGSDVANAVSKLLEAVNQINKAWNVMYQLTYDPAGNIVANLEGSPEFGVATGKGQDFFTALDFLKASVAALPQDILAKLYQGSVNF